jgi:hypothetical protein
MALPIMKVKAGKSMVRFNNGRLLASLTEGPVQVGLSKHVLSRSDPRAAGAFSGLRVPICTVLGSSGQRA